MNDDHFLTTEEVIDYLHVNLRTVYRLLKKGLPGFRVGRQWRFRKKDIDAWLERNRPVGQTPEPPERPRILVVDDEPAVRELLVKMLTDADYDVDAAPDGPTAVDLLGRSEYDLLITDLRMPGMDGLSVIREARRKSSDMAVVVVTGFSTEASAIEAINLGVSGYLTKPFRLPRVLQVAAKALGEPPPAPGIGRPDSPDAPTSQ
jgi:excisionase family DNA binding protein